MIRCTDWMNEMKGGLRDAGSTKNRPNVKNLASCTLHPHSSPDPLPLKSNSHDNTSNSSSVTRIVTPRVICPVIFPSGQEEAMMGQLVEHGPLVISVDAVSWQDYLGGIIQHHCSSHWSNHAVLVVGYDTTGTCHCYTIQKWILHARLY